jgi:phenazine biosynthesis protein phzE
MDPIDALRQSIWPATMLGSPVESAARVIKKYESGSRGYFASCFAVTGSTPAGRWLDSAITIRTLHADPDGVAKIRSGASIVRDSRPESEARELAAKANSTLDALFNTSMAAPIDDLLAPAQVRTTLESRNSTLSNFWLVRAEGHLAPASTRLLGRSVLVVDFEDEFTHMLAHILRRMGADVTVADYRSKPSRHGFDLFVGGPGPGDPSVRDVKMDLARELISGALADNQPTLCVCLSHQILGSLLGLRIVSLPAPMQGVQREVTFLGKRRLVGYYNTFYVRGTPEHRSGDIAVDLIDQTDEIVGMTGANFVSTQFHLESVLTTDPFSVVEDALDRLMM